VIRPWSRGEYSPAKTPLTSFSSGQNEHVSSFLHQVYRSECDVYDFNKLALRLIHPVKYKMYAPTARKMINSYSNSGAQVLANCSNVIVMYSAKSKWFAVALYSFNAPCYSTKES
jgi:hypothetical protein